MPEKQPTNPYGKLGGPSHKKKVNEVAEDIKNRKLSAILERIIRFISGKKRFIDVAAVDEENQIIELHQIGKQNKNGLPVKREQIVINEILQETGIQTIFHPYNIKNGNENYEK